MEYGTADQVFGDDPSQNLMTEDRNEFVLRFYELNLRSARDELRHLREFLEEGDEGAQEVYLDVFESLNVMLTSVRGELVRFGYPFCPELVPEQLE